MERTIECKSGLSAGKTVSLDKAADSKREFYGWKNVSLLFTIFVLTFGMVHYGYSTIFPAMIQDLGWNRGTASIAQTVAVLLAGLLAPAIAISIRKIGANRTVSLGTGSLVIAMVLSATVMNEIWQWTLFWGVIVGFGKAFGGLIPSQTISMRWFNTKRAMAVGIVATGSAVGGFLAQPTHVALMETFGTWRAGWMAAGAAATLAFVLTFFLVDKPEDIGQHPDGLAPGKTGTSESKAIKAARKTKPKTFRTQKEWTVKEIFKTPLVYLMVVGIIGHLMALVFLISHGVLHFMDLGFSKMQGANILGLVILGSGMGRLPAGFFGDKFEPRNLLIGSYVLQIVAFALIWKSTGAYLAMAGGILFGLTYGAQVIWYPTMISNYWGTENYAPVQSVIAPFMILFVAAVPASSGYIFEAVGNYGIVFIAIIGILVASLLTTFPPTPPKE